jgi:endonuclease V-like protein UPF0215 family
MLEILIVEVDQGPEVIRRAGEPVKVVISTFSSAEEIRNSLSQQLTESEYQSFINLWSNDEHPRVFAQEQSYLIIKDKI